MKHMYRIYLVCFLFTFFIHGYAQPFETNTPTGSQKATLVKAADYMVVVPSVASQPEDGTFKPAVDIKKEANPWRVGKNNAIPGKGLPQGIDPLCDQQTRALKTPGKAPLLTFESASATATPTDPTGAVGPNHFANSWNSAYSLRLAPICFMSKEKTVGQSSCLKTDLPEYKRILR